MTDRWPTRSLGELCHVIGGGTPPKSNPGYYNGTIPWATVRDMQQDTLQATEHQITHEAVASSSTNVIPSGNVLIATRVGLGKVCILGQDTAINQDLRGVVPVDEGVLSARYLFWWFKSVSSAIVAEGTGATVQGVKLSFIKGLRIPLPTLVEQQRIVRLLDEVFEGIAIAKANAEKNLKNARTLFESRLQSVFTQSGAGWTVKKLGEVCAFDRNQGKHLGLPYVGLEHIESHTARFTDSTAPAQVKSSTFRFTKEHVLYGRLRPYLNKVLVPDFEGHCSTEIFPLKPAPGLLRNFLKYWLLSGTTCELINASSTGTRMPRANMNAVLDISLAVPSVSEQQRIITELEALEASTSALSAVYTKKRAALNSLEKSLLHRAFSGSVEAA